MTLSNLERMIKLAENVFAAKTDPDQLDVDQSVIERLQQIHPATIAEYDDGNGPVAWVIVIPTTLALMDQFLNGHISEKQLFDLTPLHISYEALYLCSALVLEEYRRKGITKRLVLDAIRAIREDHPLKALFVWPFSLEGDMGAEAIASMAALPLHKRKI